MKYILISIIFIITLLSNAIYIFYGPTTGKQGNKTENIFTYKTPDNEIWTNKDRMALERMRNHYISGSNSIVDSLEAENQHVTPLQQLEPETQKMLTTSIKKPPYLLIFNSLIIISGFSFICLVALKWKQTEHAETSFYGRAKTEEHEEQLTERAKVNESLNRGQILEKSKEIICDILHIINKHSDTSKTLIHRADEALYLAKESGRNTIKSEVDLSETEQKTVST